MFLKGIKIMCTKDVDDLISEYMLLFKFVSIL